MTRAEMSYKKCPYTRLDPPRTIHIVFSTCNKCSNSANMSQLRRNINIHDSWILILRYDAGDHNKWQRNSQLARATDDSSEALVYTRCIQRQILAYLKGGGLRLSRPLTKNVFSSTARFASITSFCLFGPHKTTLYICHQTLPGLKISRKWRCALLGSRWGLTVLARPNGP